MMLTIFFLLYKFEIYIYVQYENKFKTDSLKLSVTPFVAIIVISGASKHAI